LKELSKRRYIAPSVIAELYTALGEKELAFVWLDKAYEDHDFILVLLKVEPTFDNLRSDPRFHGSAETHRPGIHDQTLQSLPELDWKAISRGYPRSRPAFW
jgi:hypothetical protein